MAKNQAISKLDEPEAAAPTDAREAPALKPTCVSLQSDGQLWREFLVRAPAELILADLGEPRIWRLVQQNVQKSLRQFDRVTIAAHDESWVARDILVVEADGFSATLSIRTSDVIRLQSKSATWQDERHVVRWSGNGYGLFRRADDVQLVPQTYATIEAAKAVLFRDFYVKSGRAA